MMRAKNRTVQTYGQRKKLPSSEIRYWRKKLPRWGKLLGKKKLNDEAKPAIFIDGREKEKGPTASIWGDLVRLVKS